MTHTSSEGRKRLGMSFAIVNRALFKFEVFLGMIGRVRVNT